MGQREPVSRARGLRLRELGSAAGRLASGGPQRVGRRRSRRQRLGVDEHGVRTVPRIPTDSLLSGVFGRLLRWRAHRHEGRVVSDGARVDQANVPQLVPAAVSVRVRHIQVHPSMTPSTLLSAFAEDVRHYLQLTPRTLRSLYLYDGFGSALFDAICELPWYAITRAESRLLERYRQEIFAHLPGVTRIVELGPGDGRKLQTLV